MFRKLSYVLTITVLGASLISLTQPDSARASLPSPTTIHAGATAADAAPSCWAIKQSFPSSADGLYWLLTPALVTPQQFYCDMTTDGGGYVLVGRGREGWQFAWKGQGTASAVRSTPTGPSAFAPAALPTTTIDGLLDNGRVDALADGVRLRRATNQAGTTSQEVRFNYSNLSGWSWDMYGGIQLRSIVFDGITTNFSSYNRCNTATTCDVNLDSNYRRVWTFKWGPHNNQLGFNFGQNIAGVNNASSYLWSYTNEGHASPFTQVFIRPMLGDANVDFGTIADTGTTAKALRPLPKNTPQLMSWGVTDVSKPSTDADSQNDSPVLGLAQVGNQMFVGGKFQNVQNGSGGPKTSQPWLAAFDVQTGVWNSAWRPVLDGAVWDIVAAPDGTVIIGGNFTSVNGQPNTAGLAKLDPVTGQVVAGWNASISGPRFLGTRANVRSLAVLGNWLYLGGSFNVVTGGPLNTARNVGGVARVSLTNGTPDPLWRAFFDKTVMDISPAPDGSRVYVVGFFKNTGVTSAYGTPVNAVAVLDTVTGAQIPGMKSYVPSASDPTRHYQQVIMEYQGAVFQGGSEHDIQKYLRSDYTLVRGHVTQHGGDFQAMYGKDGVIFGSCHCYQSAFSDTYAWPVQTNYGRVDNIQWLGAWDANTFDKINEWDPNWGMNTGTGEGPWEITYDSSGCMWAGGDVVRGGYTGVTANWLAGFARFCPRDVSPPSTPTNLRKTTSGVNTNLQWGASTDDSGTSGMTYEILRDDRVIATQTSTTFTLPDTNYGRYFVRATDSTGNRGASTPVLVVGTNPTYPQVVAATPQVVAHWRLGEASTSQPAADAVGSNTGTYNGGVAVGTAAVINNTTDTAALYDGTNGDVTVADSASLSPGTAVSTEAWVDLTDVNGGRRDILAKPGSFDLRLNAAGEGGNLVFEVTTATGTYTAVSSGAAVAGRHHLVGTYDGVSAKLYDNGALSASVAANGFVVDSPSTFTIGSGPNGPMKGRVDEVALYSRALSLKEVNTHYASGGKNVVPNIAPTAAFQATCGELTCGLDAGSSNDPDGSIASYEWTANDGGSATGATTVYSFPTAGTYTITLKVTDNSGATSTANKTVSVAPTGPTPYDSDSFGRTLANGWGTTDPGNPWTTAGTPANFSVNGSTGRIAAPAAATSLATRLADISNTDLDVQTRFQYDSVQNGGSWLAITGRYVGSGLEYRGRVRLGGTQLFANAYVVANGTNAPVTTEVAVPGVVAAPNTWYRARMNTSGTNPTRIKLKVWVDGTPEPATWNIDVTENTAAMQTVGSPGIQLYANGSASYPLTFSFDDYVVGPANVPPFASFTTNCNLPLGCAVDGSASTDDGSIATYKWSFGDGSVATGATASHTYAAAGTYTITLMTTDNGGFASSTSRTVTVQTPPTASYTSSCTGYVCSFDGSASSDPDGTIAGYSWTFGDGQTATGATPTVTYTSAGSRSVSLVVTDNQGGTGTTVKSVVANVNPTATFIASCPTATCNFDAGAASDPDGTIQNYAWDFGDGTSASGVTASVTYAGGGVHTVTLTVTDDLGGTATSSSNVVQAASPVASFTNACTTYSCAFDASNSLDPDGSIATYAWDFGDGTTGTGVSPTHTYPAPGSYTVGLTVTDNTALVGTVTRTVVADVAPTASFTISCATMTCSVDAAASFDPDGTIATYTWDFSDGTSASGVTAARTYVTAGTWPVRLTVTDNLGLTAIAARAATVAPVVAPSVYGFDTFSRTTVNAWGNSELGGAWTTVGTAANYAVNNGVAKTVLGSSGASTLARFSAVSNTDVDVSARVSFDQAQTANGSWLYVIGRSVGTNLEYRARLKFGGSSVLAGAYRVNGATAGLLGTDVNTGLVSAPNTFYRVRLNVSGTNPTTIRIKVWADGTPEPAVWLVNLTDSTPTLQYAGTTGISAYSAASSAYPLTFSIDDFLLRPANLPPVAAFTTSCAGAPTCTVNASTSSDDNAIASYTWSFGDGTTATGVSASRTYALPGTYIVTLTVTDNQGVVAVTSQTVTV